MAKKPVALDEKGYRKFGIRDKLAYAAGDLGCNMSFGLKGTVQTFWLVFMMLETGLFSILLLLVQVRQEFFRILCLSGGFDHCNGILVKIFHRLVAFAAQITSAHQFIHRIPHVGKTQIGDGIDLFRFKMQIEIIFHNVPLFVTLSILSFCSMSSRGS